MSENNNRLKGLVGTIGIHLLALLAILYFALSTPLPLPGEEGVEVNLGSSDQGMGRMQEISPPPVEQKTVPPPPQKTDPEPEPEEDLITQDIEETPSVKDEEIEEKDEAKAEEKVVIPEDNKTEEVTEDVKPEEEPQPEPPKVNQRALYKGKTETAGDGSNEGITGQPGDQGKENGSVNAQNYEGQGGLGDGIGYDLGGRGHKHLPKPAYDSEEVGKVVVEIRVDRSGKVVSAIAGARGTTISDLRLRRLAEEAALRSVFNSDPNAPDRQKGTITYNFIRLN